MSQTACKRGGSRRIQPYAWLGAGAVTVGMGVALAGGTAVAFADAGADPSGGTSAAASAAGTGSSGGSAGRATGRPDSTRAASRGARRGVDSVRVPVAGAGGEIPGPGSSLSRSRLARDVEESIAESEIPLGPIPGLAAVGEATDAAQVQGVGSATGDEPQAGGDEAAAGIAGAARQPARQLARRAARAAAVSDAADAALLSPEAIVEPAAASAAVAGLAAETAPAWTSWLPGGIIPGGVNPGEQIVPGRHYELALQEIAATQSILTQETWGSGNVIGGLVAIVPQIFLAGASMSLMAWGATNPGAQDLVAGTAGIPLIHQFAQVGLLGTMVLPSVAGLSMEGASLFLPLVGLFGADVSGAQTELESAKQDGKIYAVVHVKTLLGTQPVVDISVNDGPRATVLVDTGASGLMITRDMVGAGDLGPKIGENAVCFSGGGCFSYEVYNTTVDFGGGAVTEPTPVNVVTNTAEYPNSIAEFKDFLSWGADGVLGIGANDLPQYGGGPGPSPIPTASLPGELSDGVLLYQGAFFGSHGVMVFGPNPLPVRVSVEGAPDAFVQVVVNGEPAPGLEEMIIDSGGVYGTLSTAVDPTGTPVGSNLPAGTEIFVYTPDGADLLYTYVTQSGINGTPVVESNVMNSGNAPYAQGPVYLNYGFVDPVYGLYGQGSTDFSIW